MNHIYFKRPNGHISTTKYDGEPIQNVGDTVTSFYNETVEFYNLPYDDNSKGNPVAFVNGIQMEVTPAIVAQKLLTSLFVINRHLSEALSAYLHHPDSTFGNSNYQQWLKQFEPIIKAIESAYPNVNVNKETTMTFVEAINEWRVFHGISDRVKEFDNLFSYHSHTAVRALMMAIFTLSLADKIEGDENIDPRNYPVITDSHDDDEGELIYTLSTSRASNKLYLL
jgi:hypothetical protein